MLPKRMEIFVHNTVCARSWVINSMQRYMYRKTLCSTDILYHPVNRCLMDGQGPLVEPEARTRPEPSRLRSGHFEAYKYTGAVVKICLTNESKHTVLHLSYLQRT